MSQIDTILTLIAQKHLDISTLEAQKSDRLDFHDVDVGVGEDSCFLHTVRTSQLKRCCEVVLSKELGQTAQAKTHGFGGFTRRQTPVF
ncbi:DUF6900 domain-containing protein [Propionivibrio sp.]|uniref:DUF6900 domain-containing protein n=1 Tax=Propionivibrio sp. TaxID=2212460 RepID=UPI003BEF86E4